MNLNYEQDILPAAHKLLGHCIQNELEDRDTHCQLFRGKSIDDTIWDVRRERKLELACTMGWLIGRIEQSIGTSLFLLFYHMGVGYDDDTATRYKRSNLLYKIVMQVFGTGISPLDDTEEAHKLETAACLLNAKFSQLPYIEDTPLRELIEDHLYYTNENHLYYTEPCNE